MADLGDKASQTSPAALRQKMKVVYAEQPLCRHLRELAEAFGSNWHKRRHSHAISQG